MAVSNQPSLCLFVPIPVTDMSPEAEMLTLLSLSGLGVTGWCPLLAGFRENEAFFQHGYYGLNDGAVEEEGLAG